MYDNGIGQTWGIRAFMFNNINDNNTEYLYNSQMEKQTNVVNLVSLKANANRNVYAKTLNPYVDKTEISSNAIELFQKDCDIKKFNKIAMSDENDLSHLERMKELFAQGVIDVYEDDVLAELVNNSKLWDDLEF